MALQRTFGEDELEANRSGHLTEGQSKALRNQQVQNALEAYILAGVLISILMLIGLSYHRTEPLFIVIWLVFGVWLIAGKVWLMPKWNIADIDEVASVRGIIRLDIEERDDKRGTVIYMLQIGDHNFQISKDILLILKNEEPYQVYFTARTRTFLSAEPIDAFPDLVIEKPKHEQLVRLGDDGELIYEKTKRQQ